MEIAGTTSLPGTDIRRLPSILCRGEPDTLVAWVRDDARRDSLWKCVAIITIGCAAYGFTLGLWRAPMMAVYVAIKLPLLIFLTVLANGILNGIFAQVLGTGLSFKQTLHTILISFTTFSVIVGALSPVTLYMAVITPAADAGADSLRWHGFTLLVHTLLIAYAGILANLKMCRLLTVLSGNRRAAVRTFIAWSIGNLFLGAQLAYVLRPFFGNPTFDVQFLRPDPLAGNFYLVVYDSMTNFAGNAFGPATITTLIFMTIVFLTVGRSLTRELFTNRIEP